MSAICALPTFNASRQTMMTGMRPDGRTQVCYFGGRCQQYWDHARCDCSMTSFSGEKCEKVGKTVHFYQSYANEYSQNEPINKDTGEQTGRATRSPAGCLLFRFLKPTSSTRDQISFGFQTASRIFPINNNNHHQNKSNRSIVLLRIDSNDHNSKQGRARASTSDFMQFSMVSDDDQSRTASLLIEFNFGSGLHQSHSSQISVTSVSTSGPHRINVADGRYHRVAFHRLGRQIVWRLDDWPALRVKSRGSAFQLNHCRYIRVGSAECTGDTRGSARFAGHMIGLFYNGLDLFETLQFAPASPLPHRAFYDSFFEEVRLVHKEHVQLVSDFKPKLVGFPPQIYASEQQDKTQNSGGSRDTLKINEGLIQAVRKCPNLSVDQARLCNARRPATDESLVTAKLKIAPQKDQPKMTPRPNTFGGNSKAEHNRNKQENSAGNAGGPEIKRPTFSSGVSNNRDAHSPTYVGTNTETNSGAGAAQRVNVAKWLIVCTISLALLLAGMFAVFFAYRFWRRNGGGGSDGGSYNVNEHQNFMGGAWDGKGNGRRGSAATNHHSAITHNSFNTNCSLVAQPMMSGGGVVTSFETSSPVDIHLNAAAGGGGVTGITHSARKRFLGSRSLLLSGGRGSAHKKSQHNASNSSIIDHREYYV